MCRSKICLEVTIKDDEYCPACTQVRQYTSDQRKNVDLALRSVTTLGATLEHYDTTLHDNKAVVIAAVHQNPLALQFASPALRKDKEVCLSAFQPTKMWSCANAVPFVDISLRSNLEFATSVLERVGTALEFFEPSIKQNRAAVLAAVGSKGPALEYADPRFRGDREVVTAAVKQDGAAIQFASDDLKNVTEIALVALNTSPSSIRFVSDRLKGLRSYVLAAVKADGMNLEYVQEKLRDDEDVVTVAVCQSGAALQYVSDRLRNNRSIVLKAIQSANSVAGYSAFEFASEKLRNDKELFLCVVQHHRRPGAEMLRVAGPNITRDRELILQLVQEYNGLFQFASDELRADNEIVSTALGKDPTAIDSVHDSVKAIWEKTLQPRSAEERKSEAYLLTHGLHFLIENLNRSIFIERPSNLKEYVLKFLKAHRNHSYRISQQVKVARDAVKGITDTTTRVDAIRKATKQYLDVDFPPLPQSAGSNEPLWRRATEIYSSESVHVTDTIEPLDVNMNNTNETWLASAIAALAEFPPLVLRLLDTNADIGFGMHRVTMNNSGWWTRILLDDYFPCSQYTGQPTSIYSKTSELWPALIEKAYAKTYGGYNNLRRGSFSQAMIDLTGMPSSVYGVKDVMSEAEINTLFGIILESDRANRAMGAHTRDCVSASSDGLIPGMSYSLLNARHVGTHRLVQLRNPWGRFEWTGAFSDKSTLWTDELRAACGWSDADDGTFWMSIDDFVTRFSSVTITSIQHDWHEVRMAGNFYKGLPDSVLEVTPTRTSSSSEDEYLVGLHASWMVRRTKGAGVMICVRDANNDNELKPIAISTGANALVSCRVTSKSIGAKGSVYIVPFPLTGESDEDFVVAFHSKSKVTSYRALRAMGTAAELRGLVAAAVVNCTLGVSLGNPRLTQFSQDNVVVIQNQTDLSLAVRNTDNPTMYLCLPRTVSLLSMDMKSKSSFEVIPLEAESINNKASIGMCAIPTEAGAAQQSFVLNADPSYTIPIQC
eukprot:PhF_6_TR36524/c0_g1_i5/m.53818/K08582/CAPN15; calpain-15